MLYKPTDILYIAPAFVSEVTTGLSIQALESICKSDREEAETYLMYKQMLKLREAQKIIEDVNMEIFKILDLTPKIKEEALQHSRAIMAYADKTAGRK